MKKIALIAVSILVTSSVSALAYTPTHSDIEAREQRQLGEIEQGRQTGALTWSEGIKLRAEQRRIKNIEDSYEADGSVSKSERSNLKALQDQARQHIVQEQHDGWHRPWWMPRFGR
jgi:hypothetical protein